MAYSYQLLPEAKDDLDGALAWYNEQSQPAAQRFMDSYLKVVDRIVNTPL